MDANTTISQMIEQYIKNQRLERDLKILLEGGSVIKLFANERVTCDEHFVKKLSRDGRIIIRLIRMDKITAIMA